MKGIIFANTFACLMLLLLITLTNAQISYPERFPIEKEKANVAGRIPLYSPSHCKEYELLYPGDQVDDWICDCAPASIYHPDSDACHPAFRRGPCEAGQMLVLGINETIPICIANECKIDGQVKIHNICYELGRSAPCEQAELSYVLGVNPKTLQVGCVKLSLAVRTRFGEPEPQQLPYQLDKIDKCARGTKRNRGNRCPAAAH